MRVLRFIIAGKAIRPDPTCDFEGLFPGQNDNVEAEFEFSPEWDDRIKVVAFWSMLGNEYEPQALDEYNTCKIPIEALKRPAFKIQMLGKHRGEITETNRLTVYQRGGKV